MNEEQSKQQQKAPVPSRIWGYTPKVLQIVEKLGLAYGAEILVELEKLGEGKENFERRANDALRRLIRYGLIQRDENHRFSLTDSGSNYVRILPGRKERIVEYEAFTGRPASEGKRPLLTTTTSKNFPTLAQLGQIKHETAGHLVQNDENRLKIGCTYVGDSEADRRFIEAIPNDPPVITRYPPTLAGSSRTQFRALADREKETVHKTLKMWRISDHPSQAEYEIVEQMLMVCVEDPASPWNQHIFPGGREEAAKFFDLSSEDFNNAIASLRGRKVAYFYDSQFEKKVGIYLSWLDLLKIGRWS